MRRDETRLSGPRCADWTTFSDSSNSTGTRKSPQEWKGNHRADTIGGAGGDETEIGDGGIMKLARDS